RAFGYLDNDHFVPVIDVPGAVTAIAEDAGGSLWVANQDAALFQLVQGSIVRRMSWTALGDRGPVSALAADRLRGGLWIGFALGGVSYCAGDQVRAAYTAAGGLGEGRVRHLRLDHEGTLWAATDGGLSRLKEGRIATLTGRNGLPCDTTHWSVEDDARSLWLYMACGLVRIESTEWNAWAAAVDLGQGGNRTIMPTVFDTSDGVRSLPDAGTFSPQVAKSSDGRLWFLPWDGVSVVDPRHLRVNAHPPPVQVEQLTA